MFSSITGIVGVRGQANYAAGKTFQDYFAHEEVGRGRRCVSINLGPIEGIGATAELGLNDSLRRDGIGVLTQTELLSLLGYVCDPACKLATDPERCQLLTGFGMAEEMSKTNWQSCYWINRPMFQRLHMINDAKQKHLGNSSSDKNNKPVWVMMLESGSLSAAKVLALQHLTVKIAQLLMISESDVDHRQTLATFGFDSVVALELRYWTSKKFEVEVSVFEIMSAVDLEEFVGTIVSKTGLALQ